MNAFSCSADDDDAAERAARFVAGTMAGPEREEFELHLLSCARCRSNIREATGLRASLHRRRRRRRVMSTLPTGAVAALITVLLLGRSNPVQDLGKVDAPSLRNVVPVRAAQDSAAALVERGIQAYGAQHYREAARLFGEANMHEPQPGTAFLQGVSLLAAEQRDSAIAVFRGISASETSPYRAEAHYFSAKAWLQRNRADSATAHLERALAFPGMRDRAAALLDSLNRVR